MKTKPIPMLLLLVLAVSACAGPLPAPADITPPTPIPDSSGEFLSPYTSDGTVAGWVTKGVAAQLGGEIGSLAGQEAGEAAMSSVPMLGGWLGRKAGEAAGREIALQWVGGWDEMRKTTDLSFNEVDHMIAYLYANHSDHEDWEETMRLTKQIYPEVEQRWDDALRGAVTGGDR